ncbi:hypothetical protein CSPX01_00031 [Colletotrichum filicis]|nr:hypothetical protein CSPX01_00031 [Colletotrichum filicis]
MKRKTQSDPILGFWRPERPPLPPVRS